MKAFPRRLRNVVVLTSVALAAGAAALRGGEEPPLPVNAPGPSCLTDSATNVRVDDLLYRAGVWYLAGSFTKVRPPGTAPGDPAEVVRQWFAACDARTGAVLPWDPLAECPPEIAVCTDPATTPGGKALALTPDGTQIYIGGYFRELGGTLIRHLARVDAVTGALDASWRPEPSARVLEVLVDASGAVYAGGSFSSIGGGAQASVARLDATTAALDASFAPLVTSSTSSRPVHALAFDPTGSTLYLGGQFDEVNGDARTSAAAVDAATGLVTRAFAPQLADQNPSDPRAQVYEIQVDGADVYLCGDWWTTEGIGSVDDQRNVNRFAAATGAADPTFWVGTDGGVQACDLDLDLDVLFVGGHFDCVVKYVAGVRVPGGIDDCGSGDILAFQQRKLFAMRLSDGSLLDWNPDSGGIQGSWAMLVAEGRLAAAGQLNWPRTGTATSVNLLVFAVPLFADGFESASTGRWSATSP